MSATLPCVCWEQTEAELVSRMKFMLQRAAATEVHEPIAVEAG